MAGQPAPWSQASAPTPRREAIGEPRIESECAQQQTGLVPFIGVAIATACFPVAALALSF